MKRAKNPWRREGRGATAPVSALLLLLLLAGGCSKTPDRWNLLIITVDTLRADRLGCYGSIETRTPVIDRLAEEGTLFTSSFSTIPLTLPSHASILTGLYPRNHEVLSHAFTLDQEKTTLAEILKQEGYQTAAFVWSHVLSRKYGLDQGFDIYWERFAYDQDRLSEVLHESGTDLHTTMAMDWVSTIAEEPFFLWVHWFYPHKPYYPPPPAKEVYAGETRIEPEEDSALQEKAWLGEVDLSRREVEWFRRLYEGEVAFSDRQVGMLVDQLREEGILDRTLIVFTADHGEVLYEHGRYFGHDIMLYESSIRVPLIVRASGLVPAGGMVESTVQNIDLFPTLLDLLGIPAAELAVDGRSFVPALEGETLEDTPVFAELFPPKEDWKSRPRHSVRVEEWKLIVEEGKEEAELYRLSEDPGETINLAAEEEEARERMEALLSEWMGEGVAVPFPDLTEEERENLRSLGYIGD